jgi:uncharacterized delta-60 repeat protein
MILILTRNISFGDGDYRLAIGELDTEFNSGSSTPGIVVHHNAAGGNSDDFGGSIYVDNNGKIYVTGFSRNSSGNYDMVIWRYNRDGTLDTTFNGTGIVVHDNAAGKNKVPSVAMGNTADENIPKTNKKSIIEKEFLPGKKFEKSLPNKVLDSTMLEPISGDDMGKSIYVDSIGKIYVTGYSFNGRSRNKDMTIWRYNSDGSLDTTFDVDGIVVYNSASGDDEGNSIYVDSEGKIYVTGYSYNGRNNDMTIWKLNNDGTLDRLTFAIGGVKTYDPAFATGTIGDDEGNSIYVDNNGKIYVTGKGTNVRGNTDMVIWRINNDGTWDTSFFGRGVVVYDSGGYDEGKSIYVDSRRRIYVTGSSYNGRDDDMVIWRYNSDGRIDRAFGGGLGYVLHNNAAGGNDDDVGGPIYVDERGDKIYVTGYSAAPPSSYRSYGSHDMVIWRYNKNGVLDTTFGEGLGFVVHHSAAGGNFHDYGCSIYVDSAGKVYVTGLSYNASRNRNADMVIWKYR